MLKGPVVVVICAQHGWVKAVCDCSPASYGDVELKARCLHWVFKDERFIY